MKNNFETIFTKAKEMKIDPHDRVSLKHTLEIYMRQNPITPPRTFAQSVAEYYRSYPLVSLALAIFLIFGGTALAAKNSVPGDVLYSVKLANEKVESAFAVGPNATAFVEVDQASARLEEAEQLAVSPSTASSTQLALQENFDAHVDAISKNVAALKQAGDYSAADTIEASLENAIAVHQKGFLFITASSSDEATSTASTTARKVFYYKKHHIGDPVTMTSTTTMETTSAGGGSVVAGGGTSATASTSFSGTITSGNDGVQPPATKSVEIPSVSVGIHPPF